MTDNEEEVGIGIKASGVPREEIFLVTKLSNPSHRIAAQALETSLKKLDTDYLDLCTSFPLVFLCPECLDSRSKWTGLMHWPAPMKKGGGPDLEWDWRDTWRSMESLYKQHPEKIRAIGVSNFGTEYLKELLSFATVVPATNQVELHPYVQLVLLCHAGGGG